MTQTEPEKTQTNPAPTDSLRLEAAAGLKDMLSRSMRLLDECERRAGAEAGDQIGALNAAARLLKSNAEIASQLVRAALGETRHRSIVERSPYSTPGLNPNFSGAPRRTEEETEKMRAQLEYRINCLLPPEKRFYNRMKPEDYPPWVPREERKASDDKAQE
jgi:hypothetical protein